ncbi:hypothetical protein chiPu_0007780 [Chiloscyllium punctatum]|uniref:Uncharacterized protein n=1 Tax=Chiloscyllium punctatum TaxID=137246 RepID=A0A401SG72_CHIPU|nr:hypothetical protein [Chiloscyllium punctatum]
MASLRWTSSVILLQMTPRMLYVQLRAVGSSWNGSREVVGGIAANLCPLFQTVLLKPCPDPCQAVEEGPLAPQVHDLLVLHDAEPLEGDTVRHVAFVVHAVGYHRALGGHREVPEEEASGGTPLGQGAMTGQLEGRGGSPAV